jgi:hypothetical protein
MGILAIRADERVKNVNFTEESISIDLMDGRTIVVIVSRNSINRWVINSLLFTVSDKILE